MEPELTVLCESEAPGRRTATVLQTAFDATAVREERTQEVAQPQWDYGQLIERAEGGDRAASDLLADRLYSRIWGLAGAYATEPSLVEDLVQEAMLAVYGGLHHYDHARPFLPWAVSVAENRFRDVLRERGLFARRHGFVSRAGDDTSTLGPLESATDDRPGPEENLVRADEDRRVREALTRLSSRQRQVIALHWFGGLSFEEIALEFRLDLGSVHDASHQARKRLAKILGRWEERPS